MNAIALWCTREYRNALRQRVYELFSEFDVHILDTYSPLSEFFESLDVDPIPYYEVMDKVYDDVRDKFSSIWVSNIVSAVRNIASADDNAQIIVLGIDRKEESELFTSLLSCPCLLSDPSKDEDTIIRAKVGMVLELKEVPP